jgi:hypothetical protein
MIFVGQIGNLRPIDNRPLGFGLLILSHWHNRRQKR